MSNLTAAVIHRGKSNAGFRSYLVDNGVELFAGALVGLDASGHLDKWADTAGHRFVGLLLESATGDTSATPKVEGKVDESGYTIMSATVASVAQTDVNAPVYCSTDNPADFVLAPTANVGPVGRVVRYVSSGVADVQLFTPAEAAGRSGLAGISYISIPITLAQISGAGDVVTSFTPGFRFRVVSTQFHTTTVVTTGSRAATLNLEIGTTNLTGGDVVLTSATCTPLGARIAGAAITAANVGTATDTISVESSSVTAFAEGAGVLLVAIQNLDTLS